MMLANLTQRDEHHKYDDGPVLVSREHSIKRRSKLELDPTKLEETGAKPPRARLLAIAHANVKDLNWFRYKNATPKTILRALGYGHLHGARSLALCLGRFSYKYIDDSSERCCTGKSDTYACCKTRRGQATSMASSCLCSCFTAAGICCC